VALSQLRELGDQAVAAVAASLVDGGAVLKAQLGRALDPPRWSITRSGKLRQRLRRAKLSMWEPIRRVPVAIKVLVTAPDMAASVSASPDDRRHRR
jgi:hypothetical protein